MQTLDKWNESISQTGPATTGISFETWDVVTIWWQDSNTMMTTQRFQSFRSRLQNALLKISVFWAEFLNTHVLGKIALKKCYRLSEINTIILTPVPEISEMLGVWIQLGFIKTWVIFSKKKRNSKVHTWGENMGCLSRVSSPMYVLPSSLYSCIRCLVILDHVMRKPERT